MTQYSPSHAVQPDTTLAGQIKAHGRLALAATLALLATGAVVLVMAIGGDSPSSNTAAGAVPAPASGPTESTVAAAVAGAASGSTVSGPDESRIAANVGAR